MTLSGTQQPTKYQARFHIIKSHHTPSFSSVNPNLRSTPKFGAPVFTSHFFGEENISRFLGELFAARGVRPRCAAVQLAPLVWWLTDLATAMPCSQPNRRSYIHKEVAKTRFFLLGLTHPSSPSLSLSLSKERPDLMGNIRRFGKFMPWQWGNLG